MKRTLLSLLALTLVATAQEEAPPRATLAVEGGPGVAGEAVSQSLQFKVTGGEGPLRGQVAILADQTKLELLKLTGEKDEWKVPVRILLFGRPGDPTPPDPIAMELFHTEKSYDLRVNVHLGHGFEQERFKTAVTSALIYERALRKRKPGEDETPLLAPPWLVDGLRESVAWGLKQSDRRNYEALFKRGGVYRMDQLFSVDERARDGFDAATRLTFQVSSGALVMALLEQPQGKEGFRTFLSEVAGFQGEMPVLLRRHFPDLNLSETSLSKWWALQLANKGAAPLSDSLSVMETERALGETLQLHFRDASGASQIRPISSWQEVVGLKDVERAEAVRPAQDGLVRLSYRSFPSYRPLLLDYQTILSSLEKGDAVKIPEQLAAVEASRDLMRAKAERARDFMDWFEITRARETSGAFDDYLRLKDKLAQQRPARADPLSEYLNRMDGMFSRAQVPKEKGMASPTLPLLPR